MWLLLGSQLLVNPRPSQLPTAWWSPEYSFSTVTRSTEVTIPKVKLEQDASRTLSFTLSSHLNALVCSFVSLWWIFSLLLWSSLFSFSIPTSLFSVVFRFSFFSSYLSLSLLFSAYLFSLPISLFLSHPHTQSIFLSPSLHLFLYLFLSVSFWHSLNLFEQHSDFRKRTFQNFD